MVTTTRVRADAARNADRILRAAREVYAEVGPDAHMELVARRAGVGERTLYRRFPTKGDLVRAALDQSIAENLMPAIEKARRNSDPLLGLTDLIEAAISLGARDHAILAAARKADALDNVSARLDEALYELMCRAQTAGTVRADLVADDLPRVIAMLNSVLWTMDPAGDGWRRYVGLMLDAITTTTPRRLLPAVPLRLPSHTGSWPL
ncbi:TetR/AcrR family transcriptional regulator [Mycobacterium sp. EPa45]|uniref:TetR/AcrR family transcriptional regulator n=1 Tax=Mycobacterium sp. EPa45 TaxID=1545728 RepID=UPI0006419815|nr:TetR/AcrR family transcriptional regulator [Mycobacterium sp. EPa45]AKK27211.1 TetR family transcriptional regulator [Mycobacterium sp. EPa45]